MTLREADANSGNIAADVQGTEPYSVKVSLRSDGEWADATCSCPDGERTHGKCKHVGAVLLKAAEPSNTKAAQNTKVAAPSSTSKADVVVIIDDDEPMTMTSSSLMTSPPKRAAKAAPAPKSPPPAGAQAAAASEDASDASRLRPAPSPAAGGAAATDAAKPPKPKVRQLPSWMTAPAKKQKAGDDAAAKAAKMVGTEPPAKRKAAGAADADSTEADPAPKKRAPRSRPTGPAAARKANGGTSRASRQLSPLKEATEVTDFLDDDEGMGLLEDLLADDEAPLISSRHMPTAETRSGRRKPESDSPEHVREEQGASKPHSGQKGKEECSDSARRSISIHSSSSSAVPDTPEAATPQASARESEENGGNSSGQALGFRAAVASKSDDDSDDEDPAARWRRRMDERNNKSASQQKSQASPSGSLPTGRNTVARAADSDDDVAIVQVSKNLPEDWRDKYGSKDAACKESSPSPSEGRRKVTRTNLGSQSPSVLSRSPPAKPVVSLAERLKMMRGY